MTALFDDCYQKIHARHARPCSMTGGYACYQSTLAERINAILNGEFLLHHPQGLKQAGQMVAEAIAIHAAEHPHLSLKMQTPDAVHRAPLAA